MEIIIINVQIFKNSVWMKRILTSVFVTATQPTTTRISYGKARPPFRPIVLFRPFNSFSSLIYSSQPPTRWETLEDACKQGNENTFNSYLCTVRTEDVDRNDDEEDIPQSTKCLAST